MEELNLNGIRQIEGLQEMLRPLKEKLEHKINIDALQEGEKPVSFNSNVLQRLCLAAGLSQPHKRKKEAIEAVEISSSGIRMHETTFTKFSLQHLWTALIKLRYHDVGIDWSNAAEKSRIIGYEMQQGAAYLLENDNIESWLNVTVSGSSAASGAIPELKLIIGTYEDDIEATLNLNGRSIPNTQILIAGTTGSGKSNLLAVLMREMRARTIESSYPVNFLLFDYKGEFSDPANREWLSHFEVAADSILSPMKRPLPFTPFKDFTGKTQNEINLYATELANALSAIESTRISANMSNRLAEAVIEAYKQSENKPVTFELLHECYEALQPENERDKTDSIKSVLKQLIRNTLFAKEDSIDLIKGSYIIKMDDFPKDGPMAKAIVYFVISRLNSIYETLPKQAKSEQCVEIRHFTIIDEAHYMLDFNNKPLRDLIAVGRDKGLSIILATQNMSSYKSKHFDFYANAQYPLIMKQQSIPDAVIKDLFGVTGGEFYEIKEAIANLSLGELIIKDNQAIALGVGKKYKKVTVSHLI